MPAYYLLGCFGPEDQDRAGIGEILNASVNWQTGSRFEDPPTPPVRVELNPDFPGVMMPMFDSGILLMENRMVEALAAAGVDNLDLYDAVIEDPATNESFTNYKAVNVVGAVACADLGRSVYDAPTGSPIIDTDFDALAIDEASARGLLMFRLAEAVNGIVIHEKVKAQLERSEIPYLDFIEPGDWVG